MLLGSYFDDFLSPSVADLSENLFVANHDVFTEFAETLASNKHFAILKSILTGITRTDDKNLDIARAIVG